MGPIERIRSRRRQSLLYFNSLEALVVVNGSYGTECCLYLPVVYPMDFYARDGGPWTNYNTSSETLLALLFLFRVGQGGFVAVCSHSLKSKGCCFKPFSGTTEA